jgi:hypothetical protein
MRGAGLWWHVAARFGIPSRWSCTDPFRGYTISQSMSHFIVPVPRQREPGRLARVTHHETPGSGICSAGSGLSFWPADNDRARSQAEHAVQLGGRRTAPLVKVIEHGVDIP